MQRTSSASVGLFAIVICNHMNFPPLLAFLLFPVMLMLIEVGRRVRCRQNCTFESNAIEGAVFALFGLLLAFTFSGAVARYDAHRQLVVQESNAIRVAYLRLDLLPARSQPALRQLFREYTTSRLYLYDTVVIEASPESQRLQREIWNKAVVAAASTPDAGRLLLPAINNMADTMAVRQNAFNMHPPAIVFLLLFIFSFGCAFLAGYSMTVGARNWIYICALAIAVTLTIYATLEIEFPPHGLLRLSHADNALINLRNSMN